MADSIMAQSSPDAGGKHMVTNFPFLLLPAEIRNTIYRYSLVEDPSTFRRIESLVQPPITRTNKQIRSEALPIYYGENKFILMCIPASPAESDPQDWPNFIRMFRMFKAGRSSGRGTGSLRFIRNIECQFLNVPTEHPGYWLIEFDLSKAPKRQKSHDGVGRLEDGPCVAYYEANCAWHDWEVVMRCVEKFLTDREFPSSVMHESSIHRLVSTIVMVASECTDVTDGSGFDTFGKLWASREDSE